jgi:hypothetical protein
LFGYDGPVDTTLYALADEDSLVARFFIISAFIPLSLHDELVYGDPVYDTVITGYSSVGGGTPFHERKWSFSDSAIFTFYVDTPDNPIYFVKLTRQPQLVIEEESVLPIAVFPNPVSNDINIWLPIDLSAELSLTDASGRLVKAWKRSESHTLDLSSLQSGNYLLRILIDGKATTFRVQKIE